MNKPAEESPREAAMGAFLDDVRERMCEALASTPLQEVLRDSSSLLGQGKMLRSRLAYRLGTASTTRHDRMVCAAAAVEMIHAASLLHDDVIDGGLVRRGAPSFWVVRGIPGAILLGDLLLFKALELTCGDADPSWTPKLVELTGKVCEAESEQELILRGTVTSWQSCVGIARRKTGSLFAFVGFAAGDEEPKLREALEEAGFAIGTAYQLADDILDVTGSEEDSGKTLGTDRGRSKMTAASMKPDDGRDPAEHVEALCRGAEERLAEWPPMQEALREFASHDLYPVLSRIAGAFSREQS